MFSIETNLKFLNKPDIHLFADGTFQYCPKFYYHLYTIHAFRNGQYIPYAFFLLPDKTKPTYINIFQHVVQSCSHSGVNLDISVLHLDFEIAIHEAVLSIWPNVLIKRVSFTLDRPGTEKSKTLDWAENTKIQNLILGSGWRSFLD
jgi:hypothetical protein